MKNLGRRSIRTLTLIENYVKDWKDGLGPEEIRLKYGVSRQTIYNYIDEISENSGIPREELLRDPKKAPANQDETPKEAEVIETPEETEAVETSEETEAIETSEETEAVETSEGTDKVKVVETEDKAIEFGQMLLAEIRRAQSNISSFIIKQEEIFK